MAISVIHFLLEDEHFPLSCRNKIITAKIMQLLGKLKLLFNFSTNVKLTFSNVNMPILTWENHANEGERLLKLLNN